jgi:hypothetical protein
MSRRRLERLLEHALESGGVESRSSGDRLQHHAQSPGAILPPDAFVDRIGTRLRAN